MWPLPKAAPKKRNRYFEYIFGVLLSYSNLSIRTRSILEGNAWHTKW